MCRRSCDSQEVVRFAGGRAIRRGILDGGGFSALCRGCGPDALQIARSPADRTQFCESHAVLQIGQAPAHRTQRRRSRAPAGGAHVDAVAGRSDDQRRAFALVFHPGARLVPECRRAARTHDTPPGDVRAVARQHGPHRARGPRAEHRCDVAVCHDAPRRNRVDHVEDCGDEVGRVRPAVDRVQSVSAPMFSPYCVSPMTSKPIQRKNCSGPSSPDSQITVRVA
ncbi:hypothetical protein ACVLV4_002990 [Rathayibacter agropyri]